MLWVKGRQQTKDEGKPNERGLARKRCVYIFGREGQREEELEKTKFNLIYED